MLRLVSYLFLAITSALAADFSSYMAQPPYQASQNYKPIAQSAYPIDYNDDFGFKPDSNIFFSFEQMRRDQPPQVELREENVGRYMHRKSRTTTTPSSLLITRQNDEPVNNTESSRVQPQRFSEVNAPVQIHLEQQWSQVSDPMSTTMAPPPPPPSPKWQDFSRDFRHHPYSQYNPAPRWNAPNEHRPVNHFQQRPAPIQWSDPTQNFYHNQFQPTVAQQSVPSFPHRVPEKPVTTPQPYWTERAAATESLVQQPVAYSRTESPQHNKHNRGNLKFNWNDVTAIEALQTKVTPAPLGTPPPPPVPTLTPWHGDNF